MRPCQLIVAVSVDERSLQKRLFEVTGCRDHGPGSRHSKGNARALYLEHYFTPVKIAHDSNLLCIDENGILGTSEPVDELSTATNLLEAYQLCGNKKKGRKSS